MSTDRPTELTGPFADVIRRLVRLGWLGHGDPAVEQTAMRARDVLASVGCDPDREHTRRAAATTATCIIEQLQTLLDDRPDDSPLARQIRWALIGHAAAWCATVGFEVVQVDPDQPLDVQLISRVDQMRAARELPLRDDLR